jgi:hypothetical protein
MPTAHIALALLLLAGASRAAAQAITPRSTPLKLRAVATLQADSAAAYGRQSSLRVVAVPPGSADLRFTIDNPCGVRMRMSARESPQRTLALELIGFWEPTRLCPGLINLQTYTATITGLRAGQWRVKAPTMTRDTIPGFAIP